MSKYKVKDRNNKNVVVGTMFETEKFRSSSNLAFCVGITDKYIIMRHEAKGGTPWVLLHDQLFNSRWVVLGFRNLEIDPLK